ncbi:hypothetical protein H4Q26_005839 [Puccinia striiformis f. sp. tritici PST-130]|nr:hypothetical protein H4Q26_005839 [Puccinia striiformis f. sp. tritici PST-130]
MESDPLFPPDFPTHLRRFTRHITAVQTRAHDSYDLQLHPVRTFRPNLLIDNIERLFISVVPLWSAGINEVTRLTTWSDPNRTAVWALLYSLCWWYELVLPAILALIICLSVWPKRAGSILFPPEKVTLPLTGDRARTQDKPELTDPSSDEVAEAAAAAAATFIHGVDSQVPLGSPSTEGSMKMQADSLEKASSKLKEPKAEKKNLSQQYKPVVYKYGGGIQNIAGDLCDIHERLRNLFTRRFIPPPRRLQHSSPAHHQTLGEVEPGMDANDLAFFLLDPLQTRSKLVRDALDANQTILKGVPTDQLPQRKRTSDEEVDSDAVSTLSSNPASGSSPRSVLSISKSGSSQLSRTSSLTSPSEERHQKLVKFAQKINRVTERGTQMLNQASYQSSQIMNGNRPISVDLSALLPNKSRKASTGSDSASVTSHSRQQAKTDKLLRAINESRPTNSAPGTLIDEGEFLSNSNSPFDPARNSSSFFCYYGNMPGHLTIHFSRTPVSRPNLSFYSGLGQSFKVRKSLIVIPLSQIVAMRKVSMLSLAGVWGGIDGIEFYEKRFRDPTEDDGSSDRNASRTKLKHHTFRNMTGRDEAFLKLLVLKDWDENEKPGWISV